MSLKLELRKFPERHFYSNHLQSTLKFASFRLFLILVLGLLFELVEFAFEKVELFPEIRDAVIALCLTLGHEDLTLVTSLQGMLTCLAMLSPVLFKHLFLTAILTAHHSVVVTLKHVSCQLTVGDCHGASFVTILTLDCQLGQFSNQHWVQVHHCP